MKRVGRASLGPTGGGDAGFTLVEVIIAVALLGLAVVSVIPAMITVVRASSGHEHRADAHRWIVSAGDFAVSNGSDGLPRVDCASPENYQPLVQTGVVDSFRPDYWQPSQLTVTDVSYWTGSTFGPSCTMPSSPQQITLQVVDTDGRVLATLDVVKPVTVDV
jgi:prepilin-type N-terminal cleavage/methylation domain-containing protein